MDRLRIAIVIPAYNEAATIGAVIHNVKEFGQVIVVDDASTDMTGELAEQAGAAVIRNQQNLQYDGALSAGLNYAMNNGYEYALTMDADGQHMAKDVSKFLAALEQGADIVIGVRPQSARLAEQIFRLIGKWLLGIHDPLCGMKAYRMEWVKRYGKVDTSGSIGTQLAVKMVQQGARIQQLPISIRKRVDQPRFGGSVKANWKIMRALIISLLWAVSDTGKYLPDKE